MTATSGKLRIEPSSGLQVSLTMGHLSLFSIPLEVERTDRATVLITEPDRLDIVVRLLCLGGAEVEVVTATGRLAEANALIERVGGTVLHQWRECAGPDCRRGTRDYFIGGPQRRASKGRA